MNPDSEMLGEMRDALVELTRDLILEVEDGQLERVEVPEWGGVVYVKGLNGTERDEFEASMVDKKGKNRTIKLDNIRAGLAARAICDSSGKRLFADGDIAALGRKSAVALNRVYEVAARLSGLTEDDVEELAESFLDGQDEPSTTT